jgi:hypothetical protein
MKIKITFILNNVDAAKSIENWIQIGDIVAAMNPFMAAGECLSTIHVRNGLRGNGSFLRNREIFT